MVTSPFEFLNDINKSKKDIINEDNEKVYNSFLINRSLSYFQDTVLLANEMNINHHTENSLQYHFLLNTVRPRKRFSKWVRPDIESDIEAIKDYYGYSNEKAKNALPLLSPSQLEEIKKSKGGRSGK